MNRRMNMDDSHLPQLDDDLATLVAKSKAIFSSRPSQRVEGNAMPPRMAEMRDQTPPPRAQRQPKPSRNGLMQRPNSG